MLVRLFLALSAVIGLMLMHPMSALAAGSCDAALVNQISYVNATDRIVVAAQTLAENSSSNSSDYGGGGSYLGVIEGRFHGNTNEARKFFNEHKYLFTVDSAREELKSYLSSEQLHAWAQCKNGNMEVAIYSRDVGADGATVIVEWTPPSAVGPLSEVKFSFQNADVPDTFSGTTTFQGKITGTVKRKAEGPIRGSIVGIAGKLPTSFSESFIIPEPRKIPERLKHDQAGQVMTSTAYWGTGHKGADCIKVEDGNELVVSKTAAINLGKHRGKCTVGGPVCDSLHEYCVDTRIVEGCIVNREWHDWYKEQALKNRFPYSAYDVCYGKIDGVS